MSKAVLEMVTKLIKYAITDTASGIYREKRSECIDSNYAIALGFRDMLVELNM